MRGINWSRSLLVVSSLMAVLFAAACIPPSTGGTVVSPGSVVSGRIPPGGSVRYTLVIQYPQVVDIYVDGHGPLDPMVTLLHAGGGRLGQNDDGGAGLDSRLVTTLNPGTYFVVVSGYGSSMGPFTLQIR